MNNRQDPYMRQFDKIRLELNTKVKENHTIDQERAKIASLLNEVFGTKAEKAIQNDLFKY